MLSFCDDFPLPKLTSCMAGSYPPVPLIILVPALIFLFCIGTQSMSHSHPENIKIHEVSSKHVPSTGSETLYVTFRFLLKIITVKFGWHIPTPWHLINRLGQKYLVQWGILHIKTKLIHCSLEIYDKLWNTTMADVILWTKSKPTLCPKAAEIRPPFNQIFKWTCPPQI